MKLSVRLTQFFGLPVLILVYLLLLSCSSTPANGPIDIQRETPVGQTSPTILPLAPVTLQAFASDISGFGSVGLINVANRARWQDDNTVIVAATVVTDTNISRADLPGNFALARYFADGTVDRSFGKDGYVLTQFEGQTANAQDFALQEDGKIVVAGFVNQGTLDKPSGETQFAIARYEKNGVIDTGFGKDGKLTLDIVAGSNDMAYTVTIQPDGKLLVAGNTTNANSVDWEATLQSNNSVIIRLTTDGWLDESFAEHGKRIIDFGGLDNAQDIAIFKSGEIATIGDTCCSGVNDGISLSRTDADGVLDNTFGAQGQFVTPSAQHTTNTSRALIQPDGKLLVTGSYGSSPLTRLQLVRYQEDGSLDSTFGDSGKVITDLGSEYQKINDALLQDDGKIVAAGGAGSIHGGCLCSTVLVRYNPDGSLDENFEGDGILNDEFSERGDETASALLLTPDGKILMIGEASEYNGPRHLIMVRYNSDGSRDYSFPAQQSQGTTETYTNSTHRFSLIHPAEWEASELGTDVGYIGKQVSWLVTTVDPLTCQGGCPAIAEQSDVEIAGKPAKRVLGHYAGAIGDMGFQQFLQYIFQEDDHYLMLTLFAVNAKGMPGVGMAEVEPLNAEDVARFEEIVATIRFED